MQTTEGVRIGTHGGKCRKRGDLSRLCADTSKKIIGKLKDALIYLEEVRMHLSRLPAIDPTTRTLLITGYPNVGKSSFLKNISRADVDVQPYAFTTKSLYVGHFDYKLLRFQAVDTPGILDHPLEEMNTIEMQSVTSLAHLRAAILYFLDPSEHCGFSFAQQIKLFHQIKPLFTGKLVFLVCNKADVLPYDSLDQEYKDQVQAIINGGNVELLHCSCATQEGVQSVKQAVCDRLLAMRNAEKLKAGTNSSGEVTGRLGELLRRIHVATPANGATRPSHIPEGALNKMKYDRDDPNRPRFEVDIEAEEGGPGVYNINLKKKHLLENDEWKEDKIPEVVLGRNVYDYIDPDIEAKLAELEEEEEQLAAQGYYDSDIDIDDEETATTARRAELIREKRMLIRNESKLRKSLKNRAVMPRSKMPAKKLSSMESHFNTLGLDATPIAARARSASRGRQPSRGRSEGADGDVMEIDTPKARLSRSISQARSKSTTRRFDGVQHDEDREKAEKKRKLQQIRMNRMARQGEADRHQIAALSKHLVAGKRGIGTTRSR